jgi:hypothetical protein
MYRILVGKPLENHPIEIERREDNIKMEDHKETISEDSNDSRYYPIGILVNVQISLTKS